MNCAKRQENDDAKCERKGEIRPLRTDAVVFAAADKPGFGL
jgi:hypothetical protein